MPNLLFPRRPLLALIAAIIVLSAVFVATVASKSQEQGKDNVQTTFLRVYCDGVNVTVPASMVSEVIHNWIHSVEGTPIIEHYKVANGTLVLVEAEAQSFGAGHPYNAKEIGGNETRFEHGMIVYEAWYPIGDRLEILGNPDYNASITVKTVDGQSIVCTPFVHAIIEVGGLNP